MRVGTSPRRAIVGFDPETGRLTGLRKGTAMVAVTVNGVTERATIHVG